MPFNRPFHAYQQSEFATVVGINYQGGRNEQFGQQQGYHAQTQLNYNDMQQQPVRDGAPMRAPPNNQTGRTQKVKKPAQPSKPIIRCEQELSKQFCIIQCWLISVHHRKIC